MEGGNVLTVPEDPEDASSVLIPSMEWAGPGARPELTKLQKISQKNNKQFT